MFRFVEACLKELYLYDVLSSEVSVRDFAVGIVKAHATHKSWHQQYAYKKPLHYLKYSNKAIK